jgi:hypothetical protein
MVHEQFYTQGLLKEALIVDAMGASGVDGGIVSMGGLALITWRLNGRMPSSKLSQRFVAENAGRLSRTYGPPRLQEDNEAGVRGLLKRIRSRESMLAAKMDIRAPRSS